MSAGPARGTNTPGMKASQKRRRRWYKGVDPETLLEGMPGKMCEMIPFLTRLTRFQLDKVWAAAVLSVMIEDKTASYADLGRVLGHVALRLRQTRLERKKRVGAKVLLTREAIVRKLEFALPNFDADVRLKDLFPGRSERHKALSTARMDGRFEMVIKPRKDPGIGGVDAYIRRVDARSNPH